MLKERQLHRIMGCQKDTVAKIVEKEGDYCIGLKGNQGSLHSDIQLYFKKLTDNSLYEIAQTREKSRDRYEKCTCYVFKDIAWLEQKGKWASLESVLAIRRDVERKGVKSTETLYYISSLKAMPEEFLKIVRKHWEIEALRWCLDVVFNEDGPLLQLFVAFEFPIGFRLFSPISSILLNPD